MSDDGAQTLPDLSERERRFCEAYAGDAAGNGVRAAELAGYAGDAAVLATQAWRLLRKAEIREYLSQLQESDPLVMSGIERRRRLSLLAAGEFTDAKLITGGELAGTIVELPGSAQVQLAALVELGKLAGDYVTKVAQTDGKGDDLETMPLEQVFALAGLAKT